MSWEREGINKKEGTKNGEKEGTKNGEKEGTKNGEKGYVSTREA
jgi:hypothetical protein